MYPLIEIKTVPIEIEMKTTPAQLKYTRASAEVEISRNKGGLSIKSRPIRVKLDTFEARNSITPTAMRSIQAGAAGRLRGHCHLCPQREDLYECQDRRRKDHPAGARKPNA